MCADHTDRRAREDNRNEAHLRRRRAEEMHTEARIMHLDPDREVPRDLALGAAGVAVIQRTRSLPPLSHVQGPWDRFAHILSMQALQNRTKLPTYGDAVHMAALWTVLAAAIDRAEHADPTSGDAA